jgi:alpha-L-arabinofuranosidase
MDPTKIFLHRDFQIAPADPRLFGGFLEHIGRAVYEGVYDPASKHADENGFRRDVLDQLKRLNFTSMCYPGGNFASGYHWMDGVGDRSARPMDTKYANLRAENGSTQPHAVKLWCLGNEMEGAWQIWHIPAGDQAGPGCAQHLRASPQVSSHPFGGILLQDGIAAVRLPPLSVVAITFNLAGM